MKPSLTTVRRLLEKHLTDSCRIERDRAGVLDDQLDAGTLRLVPRPNPPEVVWTGPCLIRPTATGQTVEGARVVERRGYAVRLPHDSPAFYRGDRIVVTSSDDPQLVGRQLVLEESAQAATMDHGTMLTAQDVEGVAAQ